jgi:predicted amidophosphoribosyltransferase
MKGKTKLGVLSSKAGMVCPLCSSKTVRGVLFCSRCGRSGRLHYDPAETREMRKEVYIPRQLVR